MIMRIIQVYLMVVWSRWENRKIITRSRCIGLSLEIQKITELWSRAEVLVFIIGWSMFRMIRRKIQGTFMPIIPRQMGRASAHFRKWQYRPRNQESVIIQRFLFQTVRLTEVVRSFRIWSGRPVFTRWERCHWMLVDREFQKPSGVRTPKLWPWQGKRRYGESFRCGVLVENSSFMWQVLTQISLETGLRMRKSHWSRNCVWWFQSDWSHCLRQILSGKIAAGRQEMSSGAAPITGISGVLM